MRTLVVGYGNVTRSDDGVGVYVAELLERDNLPQVEVRTSQQLQVELLEDFASFERVVLIDVSLFVDESKLTKIESFEGIDAATSHSLDPRLLLALAGSLNYRVPELYLCQIPGELFEFSHRITKKTLRRAHEAFTMIRNLLGEEVANHA